VTLHCESPVELRGKSWDVLEEICEPTVTPPQSTVTGSTANSTAGSTSQPDQFNTTVQQDVSVQESSPDALHWPSVSPFHSPSTFVLVFVASLTVAVFIAVFVVNRAIRRLRRSTRQLNRLWWEDVVARKELMSD